LVFDVNINYGEYKVSANATEAAQSEANDAEQPAARKTAPKKKAAVKRRPTKKPTEKGKATSKRTAEELVDAMKEIITVQLGVYGTISDELSARLEKIRAEGSKKGPR
jgi:hypothetical protein